MLKNIYWPSTIMMAVLLSGCVTLHSLGYPSTPTTFTYTELKHSGLKGLGPYPTPNGVCQLLGETSTIRHLLDPDSTLIACPKHEYSAIADRRLAGARTIDQAKHWTILQLPSKTSSADDVQSETLFADAQVVKILRQFLSDTTLTSWDETHGTQLEYHDKEGGVWLAYPGNSQVLTGQWKVEVNNNVARVCYRYDTLGKNPATGVAGYEWECMLGNGQLNNPNHNFYQGDIFKLYKRQAFPDVPQLREKMSLESLLTLFGGDASSSIKSI